MRWLSESNLSFKTHSLPKRNHSHMQHIIDTEFSLHLSPFGIAVFVSPPFNAAQHTYDERPAIMLQSHIGAHSFVVAAWFWRIILCEGNTFYWNEYHRFNEPQQIEEVRVSSYRKLCIRIVWMLLAGSEWCCGVGGMGNRMLERPFKDAKWVMWEIDGWRYARDVPRMKPSGDTTVTK